jgi:lactate racemase
MKTVFLPYGKKHIEIAVPHGAEVLTAEHAPPLPDPVAALGDALAHPIGTASLVQLAKCRDDAVVVVSDNTRPVPYTGPTGILPAIIMTLQQAGIKKIYILIGCGTHKPLLENQLREMLGVSAFQPGVDVINHVCNDTTMLRSIGRTERTPDVTVNRYYLDAGLKIVTGLVEPHFMAGYSGGRKAVCPGICGQSVTYGFHSGEILNHPKAASLILDGNPCHEESLRIARMAGVDFAINVTIDSDKKITGIFCGELEQSHLTAARFLGRHVKIPLRKRYNLVITQSGDVGLNHYQCAKTVTEVAAAVQSGGTMILAGDLFDSDVVGSSNYRTILRQLRQIGPTAFLKQIMEPGWEFVPDQWQVQMWAKTFLRLGDFSQLITCAGQLENEDAEQIPEINAAGRIRRTDGETTLDYTRRITQQIINEHTQSLAPEDIAILPEGPYAIPA